MRSSCIGSRNWFLGLPLRNLTGPQGLKIKHGQTILQVGIGELKTSPPIACASKKVDRAELLAPWYVHNSKIKQIGSCCAKLLLLTSQNCPWTERQVYATNLCHCERVVPCEPFSNLFTGRFSTILMSPHPSNILDLPILPRLTKIEPKNQPRCSKEKTSSSKITLFLSSHARFPGFIIWPTQTNCTIIPQFFFQQHLYQVWFPQKNGSLFSMIPAFFQEENSPHDFHDWRSSWALTGSHEPRCDKNCCDQQRSSRNGPTAWKTESGGSVNCGLKEKQGWKSRECLKEMKVAYIYTIYHIYT